MSDLPIVDTVLNDIEEYDLKHGQLVDCIRPKLGAYDSIDNIAKYALDDDDYEPCLMFIPNSKETSPSAYSRIFHKMIGHRI